MAELGADCTVGYLAHAGDGVTADAQDGPTANGARAQAHTKQSSARIGCKKLFTVHKPFIGVWQSTARPSLDDPTAHSVSEQQTPTLA